MNNFAFHNDPELAATIRAQVEAHTLADEIIQGAYWENGKGCFIGCIAHGSDPSVVEQLTGFPVMVTKIAESIFEGLPNDVAKGFPQRIIDAPRLGADLSLVSWKFLHWLVDDVLREYADGATRAACSPALEIVAAKSRGEQPAAAHAAAAHAAHAAAYAAHAAAHSAHAAYAAHAAAHSAHAAYAAAVDAAYAAHAAHATVYAAHATVYAAHAAAVDAARIRQADKLVELMGAAGL